MAIPCPIPYEARRNGVCSQTEHRCRDTEGIALEELAHEVSRRGTDDISNSSGFTGRIGNVSYTAEFLTGMGGRHDPCSYYSVKQHRQRSVSRVSSQPSKNIPIVPRRRKMNMRRTHRLLGQRTHTRPKTIASPMIIYVKLQYQLYGASSR